MKKLHTINSTQKPSTLALLIVDEEDDFLLPCRSSSSMVMLVEQARGGRVKGTATSGLVGETDSLAAADGGDGEKFVRGACMIIPLRLGDLDMCLPAIPTGS